MAIQGTALMEMSHFNFMVPWEGKANQQMFMILTAEAWKFDDNKLDAECQHSALSYTKH